MVIALKNEIFVKLNFIPLTFTKKCVNSCSFLVYFFAACQQDTNKFTLLLLLKNTAISSHTFDAVCMLFALIDH